MNKPESETDPSLRKALHAWEVKDALPPRFGDQVWQRIALAEARRHAGGWTEIAAWIGRSLNRPALAVSYALVLLVAGWAGGSWHAQVDKARTTRELEARYVQLMDPYQNPRP
jgi:hypothetical protein